MILATQTETLARRFGVFRAVEILCGAGYDAIDLSFFGDLSFATGENAAENAKRLLQIAGQHNVIFTQAHAPFGGGYPNYNEHIVPCFPQVFAFAEALGVRQIIVHPVQWGRYYGREKELFAYNLDFYRSLVPLLEGKKLKIALENMWQCNPVSGIIVDDILANPQELADMYDALDDPAHFTVCLDVGHVALCNREPQDAIRLLGHDRLGALHVHDVDYRADLHTLPGLGRINWHAVTDALATIDYRGEFTFEADSFLDGFDDAFLPTAAHFMQERGRELVGWIEKKQGK